MPMNFKIQREEYTISVSPEMVKKNPDKVAAALEFLLRKPCNDRLKNEKAETVQAEIDKLAAAPWAVMDRTEGGVTKTDQQIVGGVVGDIAVNTGTMVDVEAMKAAWELSAELRKDGKKRSEIESAVKDFLTKPAK